MTAGLALALAAAQAFVPAAGYGQDSVARPGVAFNPEPGAPALTRLPDDTLQPLFRVDPGYARASHAHVKVVGAFQVAETPGARLKDEWAPGFLPVTLAFEDGRCFSLTADYNGGILSNGRLVSTGCDAQRGAEFEKPPAAPAGWHLLGNPWGFGAWVDDRTGTTTIGTPYAKSFAPLIDAHFGSMAVMAMNSPDAPLANLTFVGRLDGRLTVVTVELSY